MNRRQVLRNLSLTAAAGILEPASLLAGMLAERRSSEMRFTFPNSTRYPLITAGARIGTSERLKRIERFKPFFGPDRRVVNPAEPVVRGRELIFSTAGEYYLRINGAPLKVLVFPVGESIAGGLLRLFDFAVANTVYLTAHDSVWYARRERYLSNFFCGTEPMIFSCQPTHQMFRMLVHERFCLPTRVTSTCSVFYLYGGVGHLAHNVPEIYIPDVDKFVCFDVNSGYVPLWLDALELGIATRSWGDYAADSEDLADLGIPVHTGVEHCSASAYATSLVEQLGEASSLIEASGNLAGDRLVDGHERARAARCFYGGAGYWGTLVDSAKPTGTEFLEGTFQFVDLQTNETLRKEQVKLLPPETEYVEIDEMRARLAQGTHALIASREWAVHSAVETAEGGGL